MKYLHYFSLVSAIAYVFNSSGIQKIIDKYVIDVMMPYVKSLTAAGKDITYHKDGRVRILQ